VWCRPIFHGTTTVNGICDLLEVSGENRLSLMNYAASLNVTAGSPVFPQKGMHTITWRTPDGSGMN
jgi:hypothetical protein